MDGKNECEFVEMMECRDVLTRIYTSFHVHFHPAPRVLLVFMTIWRVLVTVVAVESVAARASSMTSTIEHGEQLCLL